MQETGISVVIPAYNEEKFLPATLTSVNEACRLFSSKTGLPTEVIVVNNASTDQTESVARKFNSTVVRQEIRNISAVRNAGIRAASFPVIVTIDADCFLPPDSLLKIWEFMNDGRIIGGALGVKVISEKTLNRAVASIIQACVFNISGIYGAMFCFRREVALEIGGFPENRLVAEDSAFAINMRNYGKKHGQLFGVLKAVQIGALDRKEARLRDLPSLVIQVVKAFCGMKQAPEDLKFWYDPDR
jgi:glycosyltransferase involved in cell wall biosynthesis